MKSYILGTATADKAEMLNNREDATNPTPDIFSKKYRNFFNGAVYQSSKYSPADPGPYPGRWKLKDTNKNFEERSPSAEVVFETVNGSNSANFYIGITLEKERLDYYNFVLIKFNKLNSEITKRLKRGYTRNTFSFALDFSDSNIFQSYAPSKCFDMPLADTSVTPAIPHVFFVANSQSFPKSNNDAALKVNFEEGYIFVSPQFFRDVPRSVGVPAGYTNYMNLHLNIRLDHTSYGNPDYGTEMTNVFSISNIFVGQAIPVDFEDNIDIINKNKTQIFENKQGITFKDINNTKKETEFTIPLLTHSEMQHLKANFFDKHKDRGFCIMPFVSIINSLIEYWPYPDVAGIYENKQFGGYYEFDGDVEYNRGKYNTYTITFKVKEVI